MKQPAPKANQANPANPHPPGGVPQPGTPNPVQPEHQPSPPPEQGKPPPDPTNPPAEQAAKTTKSIVPSKYSARYKNGGDDALANFIKGECTTAEGFDFAKFFELMAKNGIAQDKVDHYKAQVAENRHGSQGRARMTLRNMLATIVRKNGKALTLKGEEVPVSLPKATLTGAAKAAQDRASSTDGEKTSAV